MRACATTLKSELNRDELETLKQYLQKKQYIGKHLEIGTAAGGTLSEMLSSFSNTKCPEFVVVDPMKYFPNQLETVKQNLANHGVTSDIVDFRIMTSDEAYKEADNNREQFDFIFIDGAHKIRYVMQDLRWGNLLNAGGTLCLHDYCPKHRGVMMATNYFLKRNPHYTVIKQTDSLLILEKNREKKGTEVRGRDLAYATMLAPLLQLESSIRKRL